MNKTILFNVGIDVFSLLLILIIYLNYKKSSSDTQDKILLCYTHVTAMMVLFTDAVMWLLNGKAGMIPQVCAYVDNVIYYALMAFLAVQWFKYVYYRIYAKKINPKVKFITMTIPVVLSVVIAVSSPWTKLYFYLDDLNYYHRGILAPYVAILSIVYVFGASVMAMCYREKQVLTEKRTECLVLSVFALPPFIGGIVQLFLYGSSLIWPCLVFSFLLTNLNVANQKVSQDALTGLNNRGSLDKYLYDYVAEVQNIEVALIMLDINNFKQINDCFGHDVGDSVLVQTADLLRETMANKDCFISRYGGDEFVIVLKKIDMEIEETIDVLRTRIEDYNMNKELPYIYSASMGYAIYPSDDVSNVTELIKLADKKMYEEKRAFHRI